MYSWVVQAANALRIQSDDIVGWNNKGRSETGF